MSLEGYLRSARPRGKRLANVAIISSAIAAVLTAGPALGGETFSGGVASSLSLSSDTIVWRVLCFLALVVSVIAAISTNLSKSQDTAGRIAAAESANAELESLGTALEFGQITFGEAVKLYQQSFTKTPWVDDQHPAPDTAPPAPYPAYGGYPQAGPRPAWAPPPTPPHQPPPGRPPTGPQPMPSRPDQS